MKKFVQCLMLLTALVVAMNAKAQSLPDYDYSTGVDASQWVTLTDYNDISGTGSGDSWSSSVMNIGFTFPFGENAYTQYSVNSDGNLRLGATQASTSYYTNPFSSSYANQNNPKINFFGMDGYLVSGTHYVHSQLFGDTMLVVEFDMGPYSSTYRNNQYIWQVQLHSNGQIQVVFYNNGATTSVTHQMGMCVNSAEGLIINSESAVSSFTNGTTITWPAATWPAAGTYFRFTPPSNTCPRPASVVMSNVTNSTANYTITPNGSETQWLCSITPGIGEMGSWVSTTPTGVIEGLEPNTAYTLSVQAICSPTENSTPREVTFRTPCLFVDIPYTANFDGMTESTGFTGLFPDCWTHVHADVDQSGTQLPQIYGGSSYAHSGIHSLMLYYRGIVALPGVANVSGCRVSFWVKQTSASYKLVVGVMSDLNDPTTFVPIDTIVNSQTSNMEYHEVFLNNYTGTGNYICFRNIATGTLNYSYNYIDDVTISALPTCIRPNVPTASGITATSATISWVPGLPADNNFMLAYGTSSDMSTMTNVNVTGTSTTLTDLASGTTYYMYVRALCSADDESDWSFMGTFKTACASYDLPYTNDFESETISTTAATNEMPNCWTLAHEDVAMTASQRPMVYYGASSAHGGSYCLRLYYRGITAMPPVNAALNTTMVSFWVRQSSADYRLVVGVMTDLTDENSFVPVDTIRNTNTSDYQYHEVFFNNVDATTGCIAFRNIYTGSSNYSYSYNYVDDVTISAIPTCFRPSAPMVSGITASAATISWVPFDSSNSNFQVAYGTVDDIDSMTVVSATSTTKSLYSLNSNTTYFVKVRAICSEGDTSDWSFTTAFKTLCNIATTALFSEDFEDVTGNDIPDCWNMGWYFQATGSGVKTQPYKTATTYKHSGARAMTLQDQANGTSSWMSTQQLPIDRSGKYALSVWVYRQSASGHPLEGLKFWASSNVNDTTGAVLLGEVHRHYGAAPAETAVGWYNYQFPIETSGSKYIIIEGYSTYGNATYFDDLEVFEIPCEKSADYVENFENQENDMVPLCWDNSASTSTTMNGNPHYIWGTYTSNGNKMMRMHNYLVQSGVATTNSPAIVLDSLDRELVFDFAHHANSGAVYVRISNDGGVTFTDIDTLVNDGNGTSYSNPGTWTTRSISLADYAGDTIILQFYTVANYGNGAVFIDNLQVREVNNCPIPTDVTAEVLSANSAEVSWNGDATEYIVAYGTGSNPELMDTVHAFATTAVINGLSAETNYNFFVQSVCGESTSYWSLPASAYTGYCQPAPTSVDGQGIVRLQFGSGDQVVDNTTRPTSAPYYGNYASMVGSVAAGSIADVSITYQTGYTYGTIIWVDWDNSLTFDANEVVYVGEAPNTNPTTLTASFPISATTATGMYRMRIAGADSYYDSYTSSIAAAAGANPCPNSTYTIVHDYTLNVTEAANCAPVASVVVNNITNSTATISWSLLDTTQSNFAVAYGTVNDIDSMTVVNVTTPNVTLTGLTDATTYYVSVKAVCGATDQSTWSNAISFTTELCDAANQCALTVEMTDSYGDGWNGGYLNFVDAATNTTVASLTLSTGSYRTANVNVCNGRTYNIVWSGGMYLDEVSFDIYNSFGALVLSVERPMDGTLLAYTANCTQTLPDSVTISATAMPATLGNVTGAGTYAYGETVTLTAAAMPLAHFTQWSNGDTNSTITFVATEDTAFVAYFAYNPVTVTLVNANPTMGYTTPVPGTYTFQIGDTVNAMAYAYDGYQFSDWSIAMGLGTGSDTTNPVMLVVPALLAGQNITVTANFQAAAATHTLTVMSNDITMGMVSGNGTYNEGDTVIITATPMPFTHFVQWNDGDTNAIRSVVVMSDTTFTATFAYNLVTVNLSYNDTLMGYTVPAAGTYTYQVGDVINAMAYANTGYQFTNWTFTILGATDTTSYNPIAQMIPAMMAGLTIDVVANFEANQYELTVVSNDTLMGTVTGGGIYDYNTTVTLTATPAFNHHFVQWSDGDTNAVRTVVVTGDATYAAIFALNPVTVNLTVNDFTMGTTNPAAGTYTYAVNSTVTAEAIANEGYRFIGWEVNVMGQTLTYTENPVSVTIPAMAAGLTVDITANFEAIPTYEVSFTNEASEYYTLEGAGFYQEGDDVTVTFTDIDVYAMDITFNGWYINGELVSTDAVYTFVMGTEDVILTADVTVEPIIIGIDDVNADNITIFSRNNQIVVRGAESQNVRIFDAVGRLIAQRQANGEEETFAVQHTGVYLVQVGRQAARRVVVR